MIFFTVLEPRKDFFSLVPVPHLRFWLFASNFTQPVSQFYLKESSRLWVRSESCFLPVGVDKMAWGKGVRLIKPRRPQVLLPRDVNFPVSTGDRCCGPQVRCGTPDLDIV